MIGTLMAYPNRAYTALREGVLVLPGRTIALAFFLILLLLPLFTQDLYSLRIVIMASIFAVFASSWDLLSGFTGQMNLGHALFFGVAAYTSGLLNLNLGLPAGLTLPIGAVAAVLAGLLIGIPCLRLRGPYLSLATLAFPLILIGVISVIPEVTGGNQGISGIDRLNESRLVEYYIVIPIMIALVTIMWKITTSNTGLIFHAIREDEVTARASGVNTMKYKLVAFCLSGLFAGIAGGLWVHMIMSVGPSSLGLMKSFEPVIWSVFGGVATIYGPVAGVFILYPIMESLTPVYEIRMLLFAAIVLLVLLAVPDGLTTWFRDRTEKVCPRCKLQNVATRSKCRVCAADLDQ
jgi:branched-chain amino acid transport system permease protein